MTEPFFCCHAIWICDILLCCHAMCDILLTSCHILSPRIINNRNNNIWPAPVSWQFTIIISFNVLHHGHTSFSHRDLKVINVVQQQLCHLLYVDNNVSLFQAPYHRPTILVLVLESQLTHQITLAHQNQHQNLPLTSSPLENIPEGSNPVL